MCHFVCPLKLSSPIYLFLIFYYSNQQLCITRILSNIKINKKWWTAREKLIGLSSPNRPVHRPTTMSPCKLIVLRNRKSPTFNQKNVVKVKVNFLMSQIFAAIQFCPKRKVIQVNFLSRNDKFNQLGNGKPLFFSNCWSDSDYYF